VRKVITLVTILAVAFLLSACSTKPVIYVLNWGDYINMDLVRDFEKEHKVIVKIDIASSNEAMYTRIERKTTAYDIAIPSDYMVEKLYKEGLLNEINFELLENYEESMFLTDLEDLRDDFFVDNQKYAIPYFWGTLGIMYTTSKAGIADAVTTHGWNVLFESNLLPTGTKIGMYDSPRDAVAVTQMFLGLDINSTNENDFSQVEQALAQQRTQFGSQRLTWGTDELKSSIVAKNLDVAVVYSGDFFDQLYIAEEEGLPLDFNLFVPDYTNIWFDAMVIPTTSTQIELAHTFIDYFLDAEVVYENSLYVGYCPAHAEAYTMLIEDEDMVDIIESYPFYPIKDSITFQGVIYRDLGNTVYTRLASILQNAKV
jgi:spermidine/putrescine-binding protein